MSAGISLVAGPHAADAKFILTCSDSLSTGVPDIPADICPALFTVPV